MLIRSLSEENIEEAIHLLHSIFIEDIHEGNPPANALWASLEPHKHQEFFKKWDIKNIGYFVIRNETRYILGGSAAVIQVSTSSIFS